MKFRKKPVIIEAEQCFYDKIPYPEGVETLYVDPVGKPHWNMEMEPESRAGIDYQLIVHTLEGDHNVSDGDWIITGVKGEKYPCKPDIFEMTYESPDSIKEIPKSIYLIAIQESLKLQAHYAQLLNDWDGGKRIIFKSVCQWLNRLKETNTFNELRLRNLPEEK